MSNYDPNRLDPNRVDPNRPDLRDTRPDAARDFNWNWIIGGIAAIVVLIVALSFVGRSGDQTADTATRPATTGQASPTQSSTPNMAPTTPNAAGSTTTNPGAAPTQPRPATPNQ